MDNSDNIEETVSDTLQERFWQYQGIQQFHDGRLWDILFNILKCLKKSAVFSQEMTISFFSVNKEVRLAKNFFNILKYITEKNFVWKKSNFDTVLCNYKSSKVSVTVGSPNKCNERIILFQLNNVDFCENFKT